MYKYIVTFIILCCSIAYGQITCNPPFYNGCNTTLTTVPVSSTPSVGNLTGAGTIVTDPDLNSTLEMRLTDANTEASFNNSAFSVAGSGSGDTNHWNCNDDRVTFSDDGGRNFVSQFSWGVPAVPMYIGATYPRGLFSTNEIFFGHNCPANAYKAYTWDKTTVSIGYYDVSNPAVTPIFSPIASMKTVNCLGTSFNLTWSTTGESDQTDSDFSIGVSNNGGQGGIGALYVVVYRQGQGCRMLNIATSTVVGDWGPTGSITTPVCSGAKLHNVKMYKAGGNNSALIFGQNNGTNCPAGGYVWFYNGLTTSPECTTQCGGHWTEGMSKYVNQTGNLPPKAYWAARDNSNTSNYISIIPALPGGVTPPKIDWHSGWNFLNDTFPFLSSTFITDGSAISTAWQNEIIAIDPSGLRNPIRLAHTQNTGKSTNNFSTWIAVGSVSQTGKYFMYTSDWQGQLGSTFGSSTCTLGTNCRGDVFVARLYNTLPTASLPVSNPGGGIFNLSTNATLSTTSTAAIICYNFTGAPATNGLTGCINGILYTGPINISTTSTLYYVAGGTGYVDSGVGNVSFTILPPGGYKFVISGTGVIKGTGIFK